MDPEERARLKKLRALQRREARKANRQAKASSQDPEQRRVPSGPLYSDPTYQKDDYEWLRASQARAYAEKILNNCKERPYWLSIPQEGNDPVAHFYPCSFFRAKGRVYYGFLFREHREAMMAQWTQARRELYENVQAVRQR